MNKTTTFTVEIDGKDITRHVPFPLKFEKLLDEQLDITRISVKQLNEKIIPPLTPAKITMTDPKGNVMTIIAIVTTDQATEVPVGSGKYNHEIFMLEETKILEGIDVEALTFTNDLGRDYTNNAKEVIPISEIDTETSPYPNTFDFIKNPMLIGKIFTFPSISQVY